MRLPRRASVASARRGLLPVALTLSALFALTGCTAATSAVGVAPVPTDVSQLTDDDGYIADGTSLTLDSRLPAIQRLDPNLLEALREADRAAVDERGTTITIVDGWRSLRYQEFLFEQAVQKYGSEHEAERWVKRGADSAHVSGHAVDIGTADAMDFLSRFGSEWGICQIYANEAWHFELATTPGGECPAMRADGRG
ncbi:M15 family metallopeptidase [Leifsonia shinshuensis]|uniref:M15 family metallopeptidase n=1 Tax=Leifsonia shinshuensis TaxID=150026 RepID=UPI001F50D5B5|nr:M15 family metallopeptidase [Leifsonia shinshuensis]MCI0159267.1 M15 family metallopeptidase [Leifsonia shinshuensis]